MQSSHDEREDVFFDSLDCVPTFFDCASSEDAVTENSELELGNLDYEIWMSGLSSIQERRYRFLCRMGLDQTVPPQLGPSQEIRENCCGSSLEQWELGRITESSGAVLDSLGCGSEGRVGDSDCCIRDLDSGKKFVVHELGQDGFLSKLREVGSDRMVTWEEFETYLGLSHSVQQLLQRKDDVSFGDKHDGGLDARKNKSRSWWKGLALKRHHGGPCKHEVSLRNSQVPTTMRTIVRHCRKTSREFPAVYKGQDFQAHKGSICTMKFSPDGKYLASGGEDCVVRIWRVMEVDTPCICLRFLDKKEDRKLTFKSKQPDSAPIVIPKRTFRIKETPLHEFHGHTSDVLDLSWSKSNCLLTSSKDKTVRMWQVGRDQCLKVFQHTDYVTCIQFNPADDGYFISGSIDGKVRIWGISENRVVDWVDIRDIITAVCYRPDGQGFVVGSISGNCRLYYSSGNDLQLDVEFCPQGRKKSNGKRITGLQFSPEDSGKLMITSADSEVRIVDGIDVIHKYIGLRKSRNQLSASFTLDGRYIVSLGEDSRVYIWNYNGSGVPSSKRPKSVRSYEHFISKGASVAIPWSGMDDHQPGLRDSSFQLHPRKSLESSTKVRDAADRFSLAWFFADCPSRASATWPEEKFLLWVEAAAEHVSQCPQDNHRHHQQHHHHLKSPSATWSRVIVTAGRDGSIKSFLGYGLPVRPQQKE